MNKKIIIGVILLMVIIFGLTKIGSNQKTNPLNKKVSIAMVTFPGYGPLYLAQEKGFFGDVDVDLQRIESLGDIRAGVNSGNIDIYVATYDMYQSVKDVKPNGTGFLVIDESRGADGILVDDTIGSIKDFRGKKIAAEPGFPPYLFLQYLLSQEGMTLKDVDFSDLPTTDAGNAFVSKKVNIAAVFEPALTLSAKARKDSKIFITSADPQLKGLAQDLLFANEKFAKENPDVLVKIAQGYFKAVEYIKTNPDESYEIMAKYFNVSPQEMKEFGTGISWPGRSENVQLFNKDLEVNVFKTFTLVGDLLEKNNETNVRVSPNDKLTYEIISQTK